MKKWVIPIVLLMLLVGVFVFFKLGKSHSSIKETESVRITEQSLSDDNRKQTETLHTIENSSQETQLAFEKETSSDKDDEKVTSKKNSSVSGGLPIVEDEIIEIDGDVSQGGFGGS